ncbi:glycoside hydrolase family 1 protein [Phenylobacterium montanum]|uniref:beta-glucosidase n=1 Tax=Phenylobacterium montanum TaxID=2823693 RepID=A0A975G308_9CAUL|nr:family 1 glycosylhydrolase [Caulobacter sp. S6]QUD89632.1 glycoside hydrolase family 1 protein [Caulobacter sp. S6]
MQTSSIDRRRLIAGVAAGAAFAAKAAAAPRPDFLWGTAGAAYQIEGGNFASDVWVLEHLKPSLFKDPSGDADDVYNRIESDLAMAAGFGFNAHRLSIEWSRIEPEQGQISYAGLAYYRRVLETCRKLGMAPVVTYNHNTVPRWFAAAGGFETRDGIEPFVRFCELVTRHMGDLIAVAATFNEPNIGALLSWIPGLQKAAPMLQHMRQSLGAATGFPKWSSPLLGDFRIQQPIMIEAHARAYDAIKAASGDRYPVGVTLALNDDQDGGPGSGLMTKRAQVLTPWLAAPGDMVGVQNYTSSRIGPDVDLPPAPGVELTQMGYPFAPEALEAVIRTVAGLTRRPIYVTENGVATEDDTRRVAFIRTAVSGVQRCIADGLDVRSYLHWSLLDNWEWTNGYGPKFGLVAVDRTTFERRPKPSAAYLGRIARTGKVA